MGRYVKNTQLQAGSYAMQIPVGSNALSPAHPVPGQIRFNSDTTHLEVYYAGIWNQITRVGKVGLVFDTFDGDGTTTVFTLSQQESSATDVLVMIGGVVQEPTVDYVVSGTQITFSSAPPASGEFPNPVLVIHNLNSTAT
jgi:hypothetical protein